MEACCRVGSRRIELILEVQLTARALVDGALDDECAGRRDVVDANRRRVLGKAIVLVNDPGSDGVAAVVIEQAVDRGACAGAGVGRAGQAAIRAAEGVMEASGRVDRARVERAAECNLLELPSFIGEPALRVAVGATLVIEMVVV